MFLDEIDNPQVAVLSTALGLTDYLTVADAALAAIDATETPDVTKKAIRAMAYRMATYNGGAPEAASILLTIATAPWSEIGIADDALPALAASERAALIDIVMAVSKSIITAESTRLTTLADTDTTLPEGWLDS